MDFVHLHTHTEYSLLDGCGSVSKYVQYAKEIGLKHFAVTEHGSMRSFYDLAITCKSIEGMTPIYGIEFYMSSDMKVKSLPDDMKAKIIDETAKAQQKHAIFEVEKRLGIRPRWHLCAFAKNNDGLKNLFRLSSKAWVDGFYHRPRIDKQSLLEYKDGIVVTSACVAGHIPSLILEGHSIDAIDEAMWWKDNFGDDFYIEIMPHTFPDQLRVTPHLVKIAHALNIKMVATNDCHYIRQENAQHQEILLCIQTNDRMTNPNRFKFDTQEFWFKTPKEMVESLSKHDISGSDITDAMCNTMEIAEKCKAKVVMDKFKCLLPPVVIPQNIKDTTSSDSEAHDVYLHQLCLDGWPWRDMDYQIEQKAAKLGIDPVQHRKTYTERLLLELAAMKRQKFSGYFILVHELFGWARQEGIMVGPGRGSSAGSLVCYLLGITSLDPIEHGLLFERFMSPARIDMPDIDMDFEDSKRGLILQHLCDKYGIGNVSQIGTAVTMKGKLCLKDVCRVLDVPLTEVNAVTSSIVERSSGDERASQTIEDSFKEFDVCRKFNDHYPYVLPIVKELEGQVRQTGIHAAGVLTSPVPICDVVPIETKDEGGRRVRVAAINFWGCEDMGLLKLDVLGLRTLTVIKDTLTAIKDRHHLDIDMERLPLDDPKVLQGFTDLDFAGIFQFDTTSMYKTCEEITFTQFADVAALTALNRPGTMRSGLANVYIDRKNDPTKIKPIHPIYDKICEETYGVLVYQEQLTRIFIELSGYEPETADSLRKLVAKKHGDEKLGKERDRFVVGAVSKGMDEGEANKLMDGITFFGSYAFNKSHSCAYGVIAYWTMFLKVHYPMEFMWAVLKNEPDRQEVTRFIKETRAKGIDVLGPDTNHSGVNFTIVGNQIRCSLLDIKGVGESSIKEIVKYQPYTSLVDMLQKVDRRLVKRTTLLALSKAGALSDLLPNVKYFLEHEQDIFAMANKGNWTAIEECLTKSKMEPDYNQTDFALLAAEVSPLPLGKHPMEAYGDVLKGLGKHVKFISMDDPDLFKTNRAVYLNGQIIDVRYNCVGDFYSAKELPSEQERLKMRWGARYSNFNVEDATGVWNRVKLDIDAFPIFREVIDDGVGTPVVLRVHASTHGTWKSLKAHMVVNLDILRHKIITGEPMTFWEQYFIEHPVSKAVGTNKSVKKKGHDIFEMTGLILDARHTIDKNGRGMAFFSIDTIDRVFTAVCFASSYLKFKEQIVLGNVAVFDIKHERGGLVLEDRSHVEILRQYSWRKAI